VSLRAPIGSEFVGVKPLPDGHGFDLSALSRILIDATGERGALTLEQFRGGQSNPTFRISVNGAPRFVLRKQPSGPLLPSAHAVDREFRIIAALAGTGVPTPEPIAFSDDASIVGAPFYIMRHVDGRSIWDPALPDLSPKARAATYDEMNRVLAELHAVDPEKIGLEGYGRIGNYFSRQIARWTKQYRASETETIDAMERLIAWLPENIPADDQTTIVHGDFRLDNLIFHKTEPRILAVLDWELSTLGHPLADLGYNVLAWRLPINARGLAGYDLAALGVPDEDAYVRAYCARAGRPPFAARDWRFCIAYNMFRVACIRQGIMRRVIDGTAASDHAATAGRRAREMAELGWKEAERA